MENKARELIEQANRFATEANMAQEELQTYQDNCRHVWGETKYTPIHHKGYTIPGDKPGTMGVDYRGPCYVEPRTEDRWTRECNICGLEQITSKADKKPVEIVKVPRWGN